MASPPYTIATTTPADTDIMSIFPGQERPYRDTVWSWLNQIAFASTGLLNPAAFPSFVNGWVIQAASGVVDATLSFKDNSGVLQSLVLWDHTGDQLSLVGYADDGVTARTRLDIKGDTAVVNVSLGALQVGGVAVVLPSYSGAISGLTGVGALTSGSIGGSFGTINIGANSLTAGAATLSSMASSGAVSGTTGTFSGNVSGLSGVFSSNVFSRGTVFEGGSGAILQSQPGTPSTIYLRPTGNSTTGQFTVATNGNVTSSGDITANSDRRLKTSISPLNHQWANDMVREVQPMTFIWKRKGHERGIGFIAQDVEGYAPELVHADDRGIRSLAYPNMVAILWAVVQDLQKKVEELSK